MDHSRKLESGSPGLLGYARYSEPLADTQLKNFERLAVQTLRGWAAMIAVVALFSAGISAFFQTEGFFFGAALFAAVGLVLMGVAVRTWMSPPSIRVFLSKMRG